MNHRASLSHTRDCMLAGIIEVVSEEDPVVFGSHDVQVTTQSHPVFHHTGSSRNVDVSLSRSRNDHIVLAA